jgi:hypothetical protein
MDIDKELVAAIIRVAKDVSKEVGALIAASIKRQLMMPVVSLPS